MKGSMGYQKSLPVHRVCKLTIVNCLAVVWCKCNALCVRTEPFFGNLAVSTGKSGFLRELSGMRYLHWETDMIQWEFVSCIGNVTRDGHSQWEYYVIIQNWHALFRILNSRCWVLCIHRECQDYHRESHFRSVNSSTFTRHRAYVEWHPVISSSLNVNSNIQLEVLSYNLYARAMEKQQTWQVVMKASNCNIPDTDDAGVISVVNNVSPDPEICNVESVSANCHACSSARLRWRCNAFCIIEYLRTAHT